MKMINKEAALLATLCFLVLMGVSNAILFNVALPSIIADLHLTTTKASLIITCYTCIISIGALTYSKLSEHYQIRTLLLTGISLFVGGSILGYLSGHYLLLIAARVIQASGGSCFVPLSMITVSHYLQPAHRKLGLTLISSMMTLGSGAGFCSAALLPPSSGGISSSCSCSLLPWDSSGSMPSCLELTSEKTMTGSNSIRQVQ